MKTHVVMKNNFQYRGTIIFEDDEKLVLNDIKEGEIELAKDQIAIRKNEVDK